MSNIFKSIFDSQKPPRVTGGAYTVDERDTVHALANFPQSSIGAPNDEAFSGHPLAARGLKPYGAFEVFSSSWIRALENMNSVHPRHQPGNYSSRRHFILTFHDSIFECIAKDFSVEQHSGSLRSVLSSLLPSV